HPSGWGEPCVARRAARAAEKTRASLRPERGRNQAPRGADVRCPGGPGHRGLSLHRGRIAQERHAFANLNGVIPGSLIAVRESDTAPWIVSVVRWFRRLMVDYVEIGVEHLGREPRFVKVTDRDGDVSIAEEPNSASRCFAALYLPPSAEYPTMPIKTLLLPAHDFRTDSDVTLLSSNATYRMRLSEPLQQQFEYIWTSFSLVDETAPLPLPTMASGD